MEIEITNFPANIKSFFFSPKKIVSDKLTVEYLARMRKYIFGTETLSSCEKLGLNVFDLVFVNDKPFYYMCRKYLRNAREKDKDTIRTALLLRYFFKGEFIRISGAVIGNEKAYIKRAKCFEKIKNIKESCNDYERALILSGKKA